MRRKPRAEPSPRGRSAPTSGSVYVYAILESAIPAPRLSGARIEIVPASDLFAAVERRRTPQALSERALRKQHAVVVGLANLVDAILPVRFGAFLPVAELDQIVAPRVPLLRTALRHVRARVQMTVRIFGEVLAEHDDAAGASSGRQYLLRRAASSHPRLSPEAEALRRPLRAIASDERIDGPRGAVQATIHHLVRRERVESYRERLEAILTRSEPALEVILSGPWPPFAFAPDLWE
jgi:hypothetical protein